MATSSWARAALEEQVKGKRSQSRPEAQRSEPQKWGSVCSGSPFWGGEPARPLVGPQLCHKNPVGDSMFHLLENRAPLTCLLPGDNRLRVPPSMQMELRLKGGDAPREGPPTVWLQVLTKACPFPLGRNDGVTGRGGAGISKPSPPPHVENSTLHFRWRPQDRLISNGLKLRGCNQIGFVLAPRWLDFGTCGRAHPAGGF